MPFIDFATLKQRVAIETVLPVLGLAMREHGGQWRGPCPACRNGGDRALVVTPAKAAFYCFGGRTGGDVIALVAHIRGCSMKDAGAFLAESFGEAAGVGSGRGAGRSGSGGSRRSDRSGSDTVPEERRKEDVRSLQPLTYLQADHPSVERLGLSPETCAAFGGGYAPKGIMRGRFAIPIHDPSGTLVAYGGQAVGGESPALIFPNGFQPAELIFNAHRIEDGEGELMLARDPLEVLVAFQAGIANIVSFLTQTIQPHQLEMLAALMDTKHCDRLEIA